MAKQLIWRKATEEEIKNNLDHSVNKGMVLVEEIEVPDETIDKENL
jgi:hypothetical protein